MNNKQQELVKAIISDYTKEKGKEPKSEKELTDYIKEKGGDKYLQTKLQSLTQKAAHGAKLQYVKELKNKCAEDEELVYYKKGGSVDCGCVKKKVTKKEDGGEVKDTSWKSQFKNRVKKDSSKMKSAGTGCMLNPVMKFKMHRQGGSLNGISFMQQGKNLPTAPKAEDRYKNGKRYQLPYFKEVQVPSNRTHGATIRQYIEPVSIYI